MTGEAAEGATEMVACLFWMRRPGVCGRECQILAQVQTGALDPAQLPQLLSKSQLQISHADVDQVLRHHYSSGIVDLSQGSLEHQGEMHHVHGQSYPMLSTHTSMTLEQATVSLAEAILIQLTTQTLQSINTAAQFLFEANYMR
ncbi:hypothetical protein J6590_065597 [Homalodisca vitripennis]|nr:hypothetical protein J6590_065597 [Homalodisca vitripennis]